MNGKALVGAFLLLAQAAQFARADEMSGLARELARAARSAGLRRVAVASLEPWRGEERGEGTLLTERLTTALARSGKVQAVERRLLPKLMEERSLQRTGALEKGSGAAAGALSRVDALVTGTYHIAGSKVRVLARVVNAETGVIVGAAEAEFERESEDGFFSAGPFEVPPVPSLASLQTAPLGDFDARDAVSDEGDRCEGAAAKVNALEASILDLKARYWALRLRRGLPAREVTVNPGSTIPDPELKRRFYDALEAWHRSASIPELTAAEVSRFVKLDGEAYSLFRDCGL